MERIFLISVLSVLFLIVFNPRTDLPKIYFTPGPLSTSRAVKLSTNRDLGSREPEFMTLIRTVQYRLQRLADTSAEVIFIPGSGTYGLESVLSSLPKDTRILVLVNGAYGRRLVSILDRHRIPTEVLIVPEGDNFNLRGKLDDITAVAMVHCETSTGQINEVDRIGSYLRSLDRKILFIVDAMSSFGAIPLDLSKIDFLITSSNKCLQGLPGLTIVFAQDWALQDLWPRTFSLDLIEFDRSLNRSGQFRFTPPVQILLALNQALIELEIETIPGRLRRYTWLSEKLNTSMSRLGYQPFITGPIITSFYYPKSNLTWDFNRFYQYLYDRGLVIYPGQVSSTPTFRIGTIGDLQDSDLTRLIRAIATY